MVTLAPGVTLHTSVTPMAGAYTKHIMPKTADLSKSDQFNKLWNTDFGARNTKIGSQNAKISALSTQIWCSISWKNFVT